MLTLPQLLTELARLGIQLKADGDRLRFAPKESITPELLEQLRTHKPAILDYLRTGKIVLDAQTATVADVRLALEIVNPSRIGDSDAVRSKTQDTFQESENNNGESLNRQWRRAADSISQPS